MSDKTYATSDTIQCWEDINFQTAKDCVKKLQWRIVKAYQHDDIRKMSSLQHRMIHSFYAKALAVKIVTSTDGSNTAGVDGTLWQTSEDKWNAIFTLGARGYFPTPLKRIYIDKPNGKKRPLSIPSIKDRAMQTLYKFALEPIAEATADAHSYGFRSGRSTRDAVVRCIEILSEDLSFEWILKCDIKSCFDNIYHEWISENIPMDKTVLRKFLKCGYVDNRHYFPTERGIPQGGCLSSVICNMTLDGLESVLIDNFQSAVHFVRYADDFIVVGSDKKFLEESVVSVIDKFLSIRGLQLSAEKTSVVHIDDGFNFLGFCMQRFNNELIVVPSRNNIDSLIDKVASLTKAYLPDLSDEFYKTLRQIVIGWLNYYKDVVLPMSLYDVRNVMYSTLWELTNDINLTEIDNSSFCHIKVTAV